MNYSLKNYFEVITPYLSDKLVSPENLTSLEKLTQSLPLAPYAILECRLTKSLSPVDLSVEVELNNMTIEDSLMVNPFWQKLYKLSQDWTIPNSVTRKTIKNIWLEFDLDRKSSLNEPCWFLTLEPAPFIKSTNKEILTNLLRLISLLHNQPLREKSILLLEKCIVALPKSVGMDKIAVMSTRPQQPIRINVVGLSEDTMTNYLAQVTNSKVDSRLVELIAEFSHLTDSMILALDLEEKVSPRIGIECFLNKQPKKEPRWMQLLDTLVSKGYCTQEKRDLIMNWSGLIQEKDAQTQWPTSLQMQKLFVERNTISAFFRTISHIKLVYYPNLPIEAKVYLSFGHRWFKLKD